MSFSILVQQGEESAQLGKIVLKERNYRFSGRFEELRGPAGRELRSSELRHSCDEVAWHGIPWHTMSYYTTYWPASRICEV